MHWKAIARVHSTLIMPCPFVTAPYQLYPPVSLIFFAHINLFCIPCKSSNISALTAINSVICVSGKSTRVAGLLTRMPARNGIENEPLINVLQNPSDSEKVCSGLTPMMNSESNFASRG